MIKHLFFLIIFTLSSTLVFSQKEISGTLTDLDTKEPLIGANIVFEGTSTGTATDYNGTFSIAVPEGATNIVISYTGYQDKIVPIANRTLFNIELSSGADLEEVVVIGYGKVEKRDVTGAINSIKPVDKDVAQYDDFQGFLQGRASGVYVQSNNNELGGPNTIRIRGTNSLRGDNEPLYVVDGIIVNSATEEAADPLSGGSSYLSAQNGLNGINPQDIASIEVLKDASATAIYGSRGANGVILITTKKGKDGKAKLNYTLTTGVGQVTNLIDVLDGNEFVEYQNEARALQGFSPRFFTYNDGSIAEFIDSPEFMESKADSLPRVTPVNWSEDIFQNSFNQNHRLTLSKGGAKTTYYIAGGYKNAKGIIPNSKASAADFLINISHKFNDRLTISPRISGSFNQNHASKGTENIGGGNSSIIRQILLNAPLLDYGGDNDTGDDDFDSLTDGPRAWTTDYDDISKETRALASLKIDYKISDVFTYRILAGGDYRTKERKLWYGLGLSRGRIANGEAGLSELDRFRYNLDNTLMFKKKINKQHRLSGTVGFVIDGTRIEQTTFSSSNFANQDLRADGINNGRVFEPRITEIAEEGLVSFLGRVNYGFKNKYLLTLSFRGDGTSKFSRDNRFSFFPSAAFAWKVIQEPFMRDNNFFSEAKVRVGFGRTGSQAIRPYQTFSRYEPTVNAISTGEGQATAIVPTNLANLDLIWETTEQVNAGIDLGILNDRFTATLDLYYKETSDLLQQLSIGPSAGFSTFTANQGSLINKGVELALSANILNGKFKWNITGNISFNRNEIGELGLPPTQFGTMNVSAFLGRQISGGTAFKAPANIFIEGQPAGLFYGYQTNGIIQNSSSLSNAPAVLGIAPQLGDILYVDQNGDGVINPNDLTIIGDPNPDFTFGIGSEFSYKNLSLSFFINGVQGNEIANGNLAREDIALANVPANVRTEAYYGAWREGATNVTHPRLFYPLQGDFTDRMVEDGSFIRLTYVTLGYDLPIKSSKGISAANIFISGQNLLLLTNYRGFDPEVNSFSFDPSRQGLDWGSFPNQKTFVFGANISF